MAAQKTITILFPTNSDGALTHQVRNFGEDLWREIEQTGLGDVGGIETVDRATDKLKVQIHHTRKISTVRMLVDKLLKAHFLDYRSEVSYS
ncbi:MAG: hypothetical protein AAFN80_08735 [Pseudomonadota bacterium]